jgi:hypothetical protein
MADLGEINCGSNPLAATDVLPRAEVEVNVKRQLRPKSANAERLAPQSSFTSEHKLHLCARGGVNLLCK